MDIIEIIKEIGFPAAVSVGLGWGIYRIIVWILQFVVQNLIENTKVLSEIKQTMLKNREILEEIRTHIKTSVDIQKKILAK